MNINKEKYAQNIVKYIGCKRAFHYCNIGGGAQNSATICLSPSTCPPSEILDQSSKINQNLPKILEQQKVLLCANIKI